MQRVTCMVRLSGDLNNTVRKAGVSPAEIVLLLAIHGQGSVTDIQPNFMDKSAHIEERERLERIYGEKVVETLFPGKFNKLPVTLADIAMGDKPAEDETEGGAEAAAADGDGDHEDGYADDGQSGAEEDEDDKVLIAEIEAAISKNELRDIAKANEVDLTNCADKMDAIKATIYAGLNLKPPAPTQG